MADKYVNVMMLTLSWKMGHSGHPYEDFSLAVLDSGADGSHSGKAQGPGDKSSQHSEED